jgi:hypothetical protein
LRPAAVKAVLPGEQLKYCLAPGEPVRSTVSRTRSVRGFSARPAADCAWHGAPHSRGAVPRTACRHLRLTPSPCKNTRRRRARVRHRPALLASPDRRASRDCHTLLLVLEMCATPTATHPGAGTCAVDGAGLAPARLVPSSSAEGEARCRRRAARPRRAARHELGIEEGRAGTERMGIRHPSAPGWRSVSIDSRSTARGPELFQLLKSVILRALDHADPRFRALAHPMSSSSSRPARRARGRAVWPPPA